ncbi:uncharacterized protein BX664DRAFT_309690 [Halteromyces radiatus]|uniref:uncharacterized protein n=1 Tax=Halteromyces radiatus TaxID=101107 RepID=UPI0022210BE6|nr:uncharacterized protein BX664DRAFT_309690 [Halteromyces radiatus]KAI8098638.1 hypothetical protein BX664DRAFT_309690 [Halteromyces radiatus]
MTDKKDPQIESSSTSSSSKRKHMDILDGLNNLENTDDLDGMDFDMATLGMDEEFEDFEDFEEEGEEDNDNEENYIDDDELKSMLDTAKDSRQRLKTGTLEEVTQDFADFEDNLLASASIGKGRHRALKKVAPGEQRLPDAVKDLLGQANSYYVDQDYGKAIDLLQETITRFPNYHQPWNTLGLIHEEIGNTTKALEVRMVAAHMSGKDASLWKELGLKSIENNANRQAIYCFDKALALDPLDVDALWDRAFLQKSMGSNDAAIDGFLQILDILPYHFKVINELAQLYLVRGDAKEAIQLYEAAMEHHIKEAKNNPEHMEDNNADDDNPFSEKLGYSEINMLSELYLTLNDYRHALDCIKTGIRHVQNRQHETLWLDRPNDDDEYLPHQSRSNHKRRNNKDDSDASDSDYVPESDDENEDNDDNEEDPYPDTVLERQNIPLELRVRMGVCRIYLGQANIAAKHFEYLYQQHPSNYSDLYQDVAYAYMDRRFYDLALVIFQKIINTIEEVEVNLLIRTADCYREVGDLETAVVFYVNVLDEQPENLEVMTSLAMVYEEQGKEDEALELVDFVMKKTRELRRRAKAEANDKSRTTADASTATEALAMATAERLSARQKGSLFDESTERQALKSEREQKREYRRREENERQTEALTLHDKILELHGLMAPCVVDTDRTVMREYIRVAQRLWDNFRTARVLFPNKRKVQHDGQGFYASRKRNTGNFGLRIHEAKNMAVRLRQRQRTTSSEPQEEKMAYSSDEEDDENAEQEAYTKKLLTSDSFRGILLDDWVDMFIKYAYVLTVLHRSDEAFTVLRTAIVTDVIYNHSDRKTALKLALLGCGMIANNRTTITDVTRWFCNVYQFQTDSYRLYGAVLSSGLQDMLNYAAADTVKYFIRSVRLMDALHGLYLSKQNGQLMNEKDETEKIKELQDVIRTMRSGTTENEDYERYDNAIEDLMEEEKIKDWMQPLEKINPGLLSLFGHILMIGSNYIGASIFYMRAFALAPNDPLNTLSLAIANLHRSTQRKTDNRHLQITKGMQMLSHYCQLRNHNQEAEFNMGRAYHLLNLTHLAVHHYERALILPSAAKQDSSSPKSIDSIYTWPPTEMDCDDDNDDDDDTDLKREAAYNLHLIYMTSGATSLAQILLMKYCSI